MSARAGRQFIESKPEERFIANMKRTLTYLLIATILLLAVGNGTLHAQATASGSIQGTVTDKSKGVIEGSQVVVKNKATDLTRTTTTSDTGSYRFEMLPVGTYI